MQEMNKGYQNSKLFKIRSPVANAEHQPIRDNYFTDIAKEHGFHSLIQTKYKLKNQEQTLKHLKNLDKVLNTNQKHR